MKTYWKEVERSGSWMMTRSSPDVQRHRGMKMHSVLGKLHGALGGKSQM